ncbi:hypothetical protein SNOUR_42770 [Streptomyces noursei ATCC 11455]|nr:hypothetical protein SNOUR_01630 [Streptomyces noursei ATCC 11455]ANZ21776.1 hypothetical protein SNOUR_42770 [Streptomyces noursei ATCC 11455]
MGELLYQLACKQRRCFDVPSVCHVCIRVVAFCPLPLDGHVVTADAMRTQTSHAEQITARGAHSIPAFKDNPRHSRRQLRHLP